MLIDYDGEIKLSLGSHELAFRGGEWIGEQKITEPNTPSTPSDHYKKLLKDNKSLQEEKEKLESENKRLKEENNTLQFNFEGLLDMMAKYVAHNMPEEELQNISNLSEKEAEKVIEKEVERASSSSPQYDVIS